MEITEKTYVEKAEKAVLSHKNRKNERTGKTTPMVTTSKIRNLLAMAGDIYNEILRWEGETLSDELCGRVDYLRIRVLYEAGRDPAVKDFVEKAGILKCLEEIKGSKKQYLLFHRYMEALVAYHRFHGGKD